MRRHFEGEPTMRFALECGTHSPWISRLLEQLGHPVIVADTRKIRSLTASEPKHDGNDAEKLGRFASCDPRLLSPIRHRSPERNQDLNLIQAHSNLVRARTMIVNALRGLVKSARGRLPACSPQGFEARVEASISPPLAEAARPSGADRTLWTGPLRTRLGVAPLGPEASCQRRQARKETGHRRRSSQTGRLPASHPANRQPLASLPTIGQRHAPTSSHPATTAPAAGCPEWINRDPGILKSSYN
jgi:transposase